MSSMKERVQEKHRKALVVVPDELDFAARALRALQLGVGGDNRWIETPYGPRHPTPWVVAQYASKGTDR